VLLVQLGAKPSPVFGVEPKFLQSLSHCDRNARQVRGWEAGTRTPIYRSRVPLNARQINEFNDLARQNTDKSGKIRNAAAMKIVQNLSRATTRKWEFEQASAMGVIDTDVIQLQMGLISKKILCPDPHWGEHLRRRCVQLTFLQAFTLTQNARVKQYPRSILGNLRFGN
jgi:hypothetical protein